MSASNLATLIKQAVDIVDVIGQVVPLRRSGRRYSGLCPFHHEKTASFHVDGETQLYYCFGCGSGGDVLNFVMRYQNLTFLEGVRHLADRYHVPLPEMDDQGDDYKKISEAARKEQQELFAVLAEAADFFYRQLHHSAEGEIARRYLMRRQVPSHVAEEQHLGFAPPHWDGLTQHLHRLGIDPQLGLKGGLLAKSSKNENRLYDRFRNRLIFPIVDEQQRVVAFGGRALSETSDHEPKYLNSPETPIYHKGRTLYQYARARSACRDDRRVILVEGYMDLLAFHAQGFYAVTANLGTALTLQQVRLLGRIADEVVLCYDSDEAGERAMLRALPLFLQEALSVSCVRFPEGMDPDDFLRDAGLKEFEKLLASRSELGTYALRRILEGWDGTTVGKSKIVAEVRPILEEVRQPILRAEYVQLLCEQLSLPEKVLESELSEGRHRNRRPSAPSRSSPREMRHQIQPVEPLQGIEERIVRWMIKYPELIPDVAAACVVEDFEETGLRNIAEVLLKAPKPPLEVSWVQWVHDQLPDAQTRNLFTGFAMETGELREPRIQMNDWLGALEERRRKQKVSILREALEKASVEGNGVRVREILTQIQKLSSPAKGVKDTPHHAQGERIL